MHLHPCMRAYATVQKLLCHGNYCELILSPVRASFKQPSAARPATGPTNSVAHPSVRGGAAPPPNDVRSRNHPKSTPAHDSVAAAVSHKHHSIIRVGAGLIQFVYGRTCSSAAKVIPTNFYFRHFFPRVSSTHRIAYGYFCLISHYNRMIRRRGWSFRVVEDASWAGLA